MNKPVRPPKHPGQHVREKVLTPKKLSVSAAAKLVGVGRPAFSNFVNGNVSATPDMAARLEKAFGIEAREILKLQAEYDAAQSTAEAAVLDAQKFIVPFLGIRAKEIESWVERNISAQSRLPVLVRTLINSTSAGLEWIDVPGNDKSQRPGPDGVVRATEVTPWVPEGTSYWEFGTNEKIKAKADGDLAKATAGISEAERATATFVFITPRDWPGKDRWVVEANQSKAWKAVRAYDSNDLEQWIAQSLPAQAWFADETRHPQNEVRSLDRVWKEWSAVSNPPLSGSLFKSAVEANASKILSHLKTSPERPFVIAADSTDEGLAFLAQAFSPLGGDELATFRDRALVFDQTDVLPRLVQGSGGFIAIAQNRAVEREFAIHGKGLHQFVVYPRNDTRGDPDVVLEPLNYTAFQASLEEMGYTRDDVGKLGNESGRSLTVLRRRLSNNPAIRTPEWARDSETATALVPFLFAGAWSSTNTADQVALTWLDQKATYEDLERRCQRFAALNDAPVWSVGSYRGVISKIDLLFAIAPFMTADEIRRYLQVARFVLEEDDPKLDLPEDDRWKAHILEKEREFSGALREGISETLVLLAVHGNHLFKSKLGIDCQHEANVLVRALLNPLTDRILEANDRDLTAYAEAAPDEFLSILDADLSKDKPETFELLRPAGTGLFGDGCPRTGLLWALEGLAWNPATLPMVARLLARMAEVEINDNWVNKPIHSLASIFRVWMPQTAADAETRLGVLKMLAEKYPEVAWKIALDQLDTGHRVGGYSHKPKWRNDGHGAGEPLKRRNDVIRGILDITELVLAWKSGYSAKKICDLVSRLTDMAPENQTRVWDIIERWILNASEEDRALVRDKIRTSVLSRRGRKRTENFPSLSVTARKIYASLEPTDVLQKHRWLFKEQWVEESADELQAEDFDFQKREERIMALRTAALEEVLEARGNDGIFQLADGGNAGGAIGWVMAQHILPVDALAQFLSEAMSPPEGQPSAGRRNLVYNALRSMRDDTDRRQVIEAMAKKLGSTRYTDLLLLAPYRRSTWLIVDTLTANEQDRYWREVQPDFIFNEEEENSESVERLLLANRPHEAFQAIHIKVEAIAVDLLFRLLSEIAKTKEEVPEHRRLREYDIQKAFRLIDESNQFTLEQKAGLEFAYLDALAQPWRDGEGQGIPNLELYVEEHPELFVQAIVWAYRRKDGGEDPAEWKVETGRESDMATKAYKLLDRLRRIPGSDQVGPDDRLQALIDWIRSVRNLASGLSRSDVADICIGSLLSHSDVGNDGVWPDEYVRQALEEFHSESMMRGAHTGRYNQRGVHWRGEGGAQERELAEVYRKWATALLTTHPYVATKLLDPFVKTYEHEADQHDAEAGIRRRLR